MNNHLSEIPSIDFQCCGTNCGAKLFVYDWVINDYFEKIRENPSSIESPIFSSYGNDNKWQIICYSVRVQESRFIFTSFILFGLKLIDCKQSNVKLSCKFSIATNQIKIFFPFISDDFSKGTEKIYKNFPSFKLKPFYDLINGNLHIKCKILRCMKGKTYYNEDVPNLYHNMKVLDKNLSKDISCLHMDQSLSDVCLQVQDVKFAVHKIILSARSSVFAAMFNNDVKENQENVIEIKQVAPEIVKQMISFIYTDHVDNIEAHAGELLKDADMYDLGGLKLLCENSIVKSFTFDNVIELLDMANVHNAENIQRMAKNISKLISKS